ncbi:spindle pole body formation-associated protein-domain-containing protein [Plectosphaerella plurivora]|uniref:Spindle pole body formation-associated protein-domain-containing protein n=1 Tax=Plectosphaerella plurivora TaxID=936078 RepID=A0A9P9AAD8_9PEZI|nr:spindle pole body formation-associated protein-domain-containing protein [Plectosphaerella plurivora]
MLGWVLRKGLDGATGKVRSAEPDDTQYIEQPDTPAPVFAARALKSAIFGTPGLPDDPTTIEVTGPIPDDMPEVKSRTPPKPPQGILLTPGTGTSRRKRVSFDHQAVEKPETATGRARRRSEGGSRISKLFSSQKNGANTKKAPLADREANVPAPAPERPQTQPAFDADDSADDGWEEEEVDNCMHDITLDLNEPLSRSGKYWKSEFEQYHQDARAEMEKLLKYKQLAKSYAKMKDAEAIDLGHKLKEEQQKMVAMEKRITEMAAQIANRRQSGDVDDSADLMKNLAKQTALAVQYRTQVQDLEAMVGESEGGNDADSEHRRRRASPRTQKTLLETQRELRRARTHIKENADLRAQLRRLQAQLDVAEEKAAQLAARKSLEGEESGHKGPASAQEIDELRLENRLLKNELQALKEATVQKELDTKQVLEKTTAKISDLKKEIKTLKAGRPADTKPAIITANDPTRTLRRLSDHGPKPKTNSSAWQPASPVKGDKDGIDLVTSLGKRLNAQPPNLRSQYKKDAGGPYPFEDIALQKKPEEKPSTPEPKSKNIMESKPELEAPKWKPFIPRSPRNREQLGSDLNWMLTKSTAVPTGQTPARHRFKPEEEAAIDLLQNQYHRLGGAPAATDDSMAHATKSSSLPPERRAAAIARIERRKAEKRMMAQNSMLSPNKENVAP